MHWLDAGVGDEGKAVEPAFEGECTSMDVVDLDPPAVRPPCHCPLRPVRGLVEELAKADEDLEGGHMGRGWTIHLAKKKMTARPAPQTTPTASPWKNPRASAIGQSTGGRSDGFIISAS